MFLIFPAFMSIENLGEFDLAKLPGCERPEKKLMFKQLRKNFNPFALNVQTTSLIHEKLYFHVIWSSFMIRSIVSCFDQGCCSNEIFMMSNLFIFLVLIRMQKETLRRHRYLSTAKQN